MFVYPTLQVTLKKIVRWCQVRSSRLPIYKTIGHLNINMCSATYCLKLFNVNKSVCGEGVYILGSSAILSRTKLPVQL